MNLGAASPAPSSGRRTQDDAVMAAMAFTSRPSQGIRQRRVLDNDSAERNRDRILTAARDAFAG
jgi:hypothetical protein